MDKQQVLKYASAMKLPRTKKMLQRDMMLKRKLQYSAALLMMYSQGTGYSQNDLKKQIDFLTQLYRHLSGSPDRGRTASLVSDALRNVQRSLQLYGRGQNERVSQLLSSARLSLAKAYADYQ
jgi:hypothetical protein